jgi:tetratricopeptide (TPR) repeat protein
MTHFLYLFSMAYWKQGAIMEGLGCISEALKVIQQTHEECYLSLIYCQKGKLHLLEGEKAVFKAEEAFLKALEVAKRQDAKW